MASGDSTNTSTQTTGSANPAVTSTLNKLLGSGGGVQGIFDSGPHVFNQSLYGGVGDTTKNAWSSSLDAAGNPTYMSGVTGALGNQANIAAGNDYGTADPGYATLRNKLSNDVLTSTNSAFNSSGLFGSDSNQKAAASGLADSLGALDYQNYQNDQQRQQQAIQNLPGLFSALQAPSATAGAVGAAQDANTQATLSGNADLYNRTQNASLGLLQQLMGTLGSGVAAGGTTTTQTQPATPWWQQLLGAGAVGAGIYGALR